MNVRHIRRGLVALLIGFAFIGAAFAAPGGPLSAQAAGADDGPASGVTSVEPVPYDLPRVVERALSHHLGVRVSRLQQAVVERQVTEQQAALKPSLSVTARPAWFETPVPDFDALESGFDSGKLRDLVDEVDWDECRNNDDCEGLEDVFDELDRQLNSLQDQLADGIPQKLESGRSHEIAFNGSVPVWRSPLQRAVADAAHWQLAGAEAESDEAAAGAVLQGIDAYFAVVRADAEVRIAELTLEETEVRLRETESKVEAGTATNLDRLQIEAERHGAEAGVVQAQGEATAARMMLNSALGFDLNVPLQVASPPALADGKRAAASFGVEDALRSAVESGDVRKAYTDWRLAGAGAIVEAEQAKPDIQLFATGEWPDVELTLGVDRHGYLGGSVAWSETYMGGDRMDEDDPASWFAGFEVTWTLFDGGKQKAAVEAARLQEEQAQLYYEHVSETARTEVLTAYVRWQAAEEGLRGARRGVEAAGEGLDVARQLAEAGAATESAVLQARLGVARAEQAYVDALYGATMAHSAYLHAAGELVPYWQQVVTARP